MTSFALRAEPRPATRLAAFAGLLHVGAAATPWLLGVRPAIALVLSFVALAGLASTLACLPGVHHRLAALTVDEAGVRVRERGAASFIPAKLGPGSRAYPGLVFADIRTGGRRCGWLLARGSLPPGDFRRLKARIRVS
jgi:hypothetical protein